MTPQAVSKALSRAGFTRAKRELTPIKGLPSWSEGYHVANSSQGVLVEHVLNEYGELPASKGRRTKYLRLYEGALSKAGYDTELSKYADGSLSRIVVKGKKQ